MPKLLTNAMVYRSKLMKKVLSIISNKKKKMVRTSNRLRIINKKIKNRTTTLRTNIMMLSSITIITKTSLTSLMLIKLKQVSLKTVNYQFKNGKRSLPEIIRKID